MNHSTMCALITVFVIILLYIYNALFDMLQMTGPFFSRFCNLVSGASDIPSVVDLRQELAV